MPEHRFKVGSVQGLIMIVANFERDHGIADPPRFLEGFKEWCEDTNTDLGNVKSVRTKLNRMSQGAQKPAWYLDAQQFYGDELDHGRNELILSVDEGDSGPAPTSVDTGNEETLSMPVGGVEGGEPSASNKSAEEPEREQREEGSEEATEEGAGKIEGALGEEIEDVTRVDVIPDSKTFAELDAEKGIETVNDGPDAPDIPGPHDRE